MSDTWSEPPADPGRGRLFATLPPAMWFRLAVILRIPLVVLAAPIVIYRTVPQTAGDLHYQVRVNRFTGEACIIFDNDDVPASLREFSC